MVKMPISYDSDISFQNNSYNKVIIKQYINLSLPPISSGFKHITKPLLSYLLAYFEFLQ